MDISNFGDNTFSFIDQNGSTKEQTHNMLKNSLIYTMIKSKNYYDSSEFEIRNVRHFLDKAILTIVEYLFCISSTVFLTKTN